MVVVLLVVVLFDIVIVGGGGGDGDAVVVFGEIVEVEVACFAFIVVDTDAANVDDEALLVVFRVVVVGFLAAIKKNKFLVKCNFIKINLSHTQNIPFVVVDVDDFLTGALVVFKVARCVLVVVAFDSIDDLTIDKVDVGNGEVFGISVELGSFFNSLVVLISLVDGVPVLKVS